MKTPEQLTVQMLSIMPHILNANVIPYLFELVELAQKEAWNEAIEAVQGLPHTTSATGHSCIYSDDIEKLKK